MDVFIKSIWKPMGLCPNKKSLEILHPIHPKRLEVSNQSRGKDSGNSPVLPSGWLNKRHNRELIISSTLFSVLPLIFLYFLFSHFGWGSILAFIPAFSLVVIVYYFKLDSVHSIISLSNSSSWSGWKFRLVLISSFCLTSFLYYLKIYAGKRKITRSNICGSYMPEIYNVNEEVE